MAVGRGEEVTGLDTEIPFPLVAMKAAAEEEEGLLLARLLLLWPLFAVWCPCPCPVPPFEVAEVSEDFFEEGGGFVKRICFLRAFDDSIHLCKK